MSKKNIVIILVLLILLIAVIISVYLYERKIEVSQNLNISKALSESATSENTNDTISTNSYSPEHIEYIKQSNNNYEAVDLQELEKRSIENVKVEVLEDTISQNGATVVITDNNDISFSWNKEIYKIEEKKEESWREVTPNRNGFDCTVGYGRDENNQFRFELNWEEIYGSLKNGTYRIVEIPSDDSKAVVYSNEFEIRNEK